MDAVPIHDHVVVGVDGSAGSIAALHWAARAASRRRRPMHLVTGINDAWPGAGFAAGLRSAVADLVTAARTLAPGIPVSGEVAGGGPGPALATESARAATVVVGARRPGAIAGLRPGSVSAYLAARAQCPVVVVPAGWDAEAATGPVVVGLDGSEVANLAAEFAFAEAAACGAALLAVRAYDGGPTDGPAALRQGLARSLARWAPIHPAVPLDGRVVAGPAVEVLATAARDAQLLVVGSRGLGGVRGFLLGSVSLRLLHHATCPVAVVHPHHHDHGHRRHRRVAAATA